MIKNKKPYYFFITLVIFFQLNPVVSFSQLKQFEFEQIEYLQKKEKKHVVVFIHTEWCRYCAAMLHNGFKDQAVISILNNNFYFISLNAEKKEDIYFNSRLFRFIPNGNETGKHELAEELGSVNGKISYPAICILDFNNAIIFQQTGFLSTKELILILKKI